MTRLLHTPSIVTSGRRELKTAIKKPYQHILIAAQKNLLAKNAQPPADIEYITDAAGNRTPVVSEEWKAYGSGTALFLIPSILLTRWR